MASEEQQPLNVIISATASRQLAAIWEWNKEQYGIDHANAYVDFLKQSVDGLATSYEHHPRVGTRHALRYCQMRWTRGGHFHVAVYRIENKNVRILNIFHSAQNSRAKYKEN